MHTPPPPLPLSAFRDQFSDLGSRVWLNCQGVSPGADVVTTAVGRALRSWREGTFDWLDWELAAERARGRFAALIGVLPEHVAIVGTLAEAAATIAASLPLPKRLAGRRCIVVSNAEFRSNLYPWLALKARGFTLRLVPDDAPPTAARYIECLADDVLLVAVSDVQSQTGVRIDVPGLASACRGAGARLFVNLTQSAGVLRFNAGEASADYVAVHAYKWMLSPRGATFLYVRPELIGESHALAPNWKNAPKSYEQLYGGPLEWSASARRLDASLSWHAWVGAEAALSLLRQFDALEIEQRALALADALRRELRACGTALPDGDLPSQLVAIPLPSDIEALALQRQLADAALVVSARGHWLRVGFHGFNTMADLDRLLDALPRTTIAAPP